MKRIRIGSRQGPLDLAETAREAATAMDRLWAMGLLPGEARLDPLAPPALGRIFEAARKAGIGASRLPGLSASRNGRPADIREALQRLGEALAGSPNPDSEWGQINRVLGSDLLAALTGVSTASLARYRAGRRPTPDPVAARLHFLAMVVADLAGSYNEFGIRRWFERPRHQLGEKTPRIFLEGDWRPEQPGAQRVKELAEALAGSPVT